MQYVVSEEVMLIIRVLGTLKKDWLSQIRKILSKKLINALYDDVLVNFVLNVS